MQPSAAPLLVRCQNPAAQYAASAARAAPCSRLMSRNAGGRMRHLPRLCSCSASQIGTSTGMLGRKGPYSPWVLRGAAGGWAALRVWEGCQQMRAQQAARECCTRARARASTHPCAAEHAAGVVPQLEARDNGDGLLLCEELQLRVCEGGTGVMCIEQRMRTRRIGARLCATPRHTAPPQRPGWCLQTPLAFQALPTSSAATGSLILFATGFAMAPAPWGRLARGPRRLLGVF